MPSYRKLKFIPIVLAVFLIAPALTTKAVAVMPQPGQAAFYHDAEEDSRPAFKNGEVLVKMRDLAGEREVKAFTFRHNISKADKLRSEQVVKNVYKVKLQIGASVEDAVAEFKADPDVEQAQPNYIHHAMQTPNDPSFGQLWGLRNTGQTVGGVAGKPGADIGASAAWDISTGSSGVVVGIVDTGIDYNHPDLVANLWTNPGEIPNNGIDDDGNGYVDDIHGINSITGSGDPLDDNGHGTHVSGTIGARGNNGVGVAGVNWTTGIMALKFLDKTGSGFTSDAIECINYAVAMKKKGVNVRALNNSWGGGPFEPLLDSAISAAGANDILFVAAAGNEANDNDKKPAYPASYSDANVIAVAATTNQDKLASFSNFGLNSVHVAAPGVGIFSTYMTSQGSYQSLSGTSMATPHVTGLAALLIAAKPALSTLQVKDIILNTVDPVGLPILTGGRINAGRALNAALNQQLTLTEAQDGGNVILRALVNNGGAMPPNVSVTFFQDGVQVGTASTALGPQGTTLPATLKFKGSLGQHDARAVSAPSGGIPALNSATISYTIAPPVITSLSRTSTLPRPSVVVNGTNFGSATGRILITGNGKTKSIKTQTWSDTRVTFIAPRLRAGAYTLSLNNGLATSAPVVFTAP